jgi:NTE family protein
MIKKYYIFFSFIAAVTTSSSAQGQSSWISIPLGYEGVPTGRDGVLPYHQEIRPRIALALSGGGARGLAHIGVLKVLERNGIPVDGIAGTSMGAIIGALASVGYSSGQIDSLVRIADWGGIIRDAPQRRQLFLGQKEQRARTIVQVRFEKWSLDFRPAVTAGQKLTTVLTDILLRAPAPYPGDFDRLPIPLRVVTTDLLTGGKVLFDRGSLVDALRGTLAIPLLFTPLETDRHLLVDGGLVDNLPVREARSIGADRVIAVDTSSKLRKRDDLNAPWEIADQVTTIMEQDAVAEAKRAADLVIEPVLEQRSNTDFSRIDELVRAGEEAAERAVPAIDSLLASFPSTVPDGWVRVAECRFSGLDRVSLHADAPLFEPPDPGPVRLSDLVLSGRSLYQSGCFLSVSMALDTSIGVLRYDVVENPSIDSIRFEGNTAYSDSALMSRLSTRPGAVFNHRKGRADLQGIRSLYLEGGYSLARVDTAEIRGNTLVFRIDEGRIDAIRFAGNARTRGFILRRELPFHAGDLFNAAAFEQGLENIYSTGYFETIRFDLNAVRDKRVLTLRLKEQGFSLLRAGLRYDLERRTQCLIEGTEENLFGIGAVGSWTGLLGAVDRGFRLGFRADRIFQTLLTAKGSFSASRQDFNSYSGFVRTGRYRYGSMQTSLSVGQQMKRFGTLSVEIRDEHLRVRPLSGSAPPREVETLRNIVLRSEVDTRDRLPFPNAGKYHVLEYETSASFLGSDIPYTRMFSSMESYYPFFRRFVLHPRIRWGTADLTTPFAKQYRFGGMESFWGLPEEAMTGRQFFIFSGEARWRVPWFRWVESHVSFRYDLGGAWLRVRDLQARDFRQGMGFMYSVQTPFGPVQAAIGKLDGEKRARFYFSAGYRF